MEECVWLSDGAYFLEFRRRKLWCGWRGELGHIVDGLGWQAETVWLWGMFKSCKENTCNHDMICTFAYSTNIWNPLCSPFSNVILSAMRWDRISLVNEAKPKPTQLVGPRDPHHCSCLLHRGFRWQILSEALPLGQSCAKPIVLDASRQWSKHWVWMPPQAPSRLLADALWPMWTEVTCWEAAPVPFSGCFLSCHSVPGAGDKQSRDQILALCSHSSDKGSNSDQTS